MGRASIAQRLEASRNGHGGSGRSRRGFHSTTEVLLTVIVVQNRVARRSIDDSRFVINDRRIAIDDAWLAIHYGWLAIHYGWLLIHDRRGTGTCNTGVVMIVARAHLDGRRTAAEQCTNRHGP
jgi:hypothetical protein